MLVSLAAAIALGAASISDIALLAHLASVLGDAPSGPTVRRALDLAGTAAMLDRIARARAKARAHVRDLIEKTPAGFPWLVIAGKTLTGWLVIDMDATLVTASSDKEATLPPGRRAMASTRWAQLVAQQKDLGVLPRRRTPGQPQPRRYLDGEKEHETQAHETRSSTTGMPYCKPDAP